MNKDPDQPDFDTLYDQLSASNPWKDPWFRPNDSSIVWADAGESWDVAEGRYEYEWFRISEHYDSDEYSLFGTEGIRPEDIFQGKIGNCWFMSALSAIAEKPNRVEKMFLNKSDAIEEKGVYGINMYALGVPHTVLVDDYIPIRKDKHGRLSNLFARSTKRGHGDKSLWAPIFEKAFAKFYGNYNHIEGGYTFNAIQALQGGPYELYLHEENDSYKRDAGSQIVADVETLWSLLKAHDLNHEIMATDSGKSVNREKTGLVPSHAWTTLGVTEAVPDVRLVKVRNPWGSSEMYKGPWCDECAEWDDVPQDIKDTLSFT